MTKRKVIALGKRSYVVTLPLSWMSRHGISVGDELEASEEDGTLRLTTEKRKARKTIDLDVRSLDSMLNRYLGALYKAGYDDVQLKIEKKQLKGIEDILRRTCVGWEIVKVSGDTVFIRQIASLEAENVDDLIKRTFFTLQTMGEELEAAVAPKQRQRLQDIIKKDDQVNRLVDSARRSLNKRRSEFLTYAIVEQLEKIGDWYKMTAGAILQNEIQISAQNLSLVNGLLKEMYNLYYVFSFETMERFGRTSEDVRKKIKGDPWLLSLYGLIFDLNGLILTGKV